MRSEYFCLFDHLGELFVSNLLVPGLGGLHKKLLQLLVVEGFAQLLGDLLEFAEVDAAVAVQVEQCEGLLHLLVGVPGRHLLGHEGRERFVGDDSLAGLIVLREQVLELVLLELEAEGPHGHLELLAVDETGVVSVEEVEGFLDLALEVLVDLPDLLLHLGPLLHPLQSIQILTTAPFNMDIDKLIQGLRHLKVLSERDLKALCKKAIEILVEESNVQPVKAPVNVVGDIHGQLYDFLELLRIGGDPADTNYVFLGDYVDRGFNSVEVWQLLLCYKVKYPDRVTLLRGNHESRQVTLTYGFHEESLRKYGNPSPWKYCNEVFDYLPLGAVIEGRIFCVHGGLSPSVKTIDQIRLIDRCQEIPSKGPFADLMWSDPDNISTWLENERGAGWFFGHRPVTDFARINNLDLIARAHQLVNEGYHYWFEEKKLVTVWSAPNYCNRCGNDASVMRVDEDLDRKFSIFKAVGESGKAVNYRSLLPYFL